ncbi:MAG TPA: aminoacyl-tRNA hydrolase [Myxococcales bacterium]|nr:aminoacyl-tRNA hydrolase [Myxococcales bacterium]
MSGASKAKANPAPLLAIVGLGNPGARYDQTRHNLGFLIADELARRHFVSWQGKFKGQYGRWSSTGQDLFLLKPETFMNLSGQSVQAMSRFFRISTESILVIHDDLDLSFGHIRLKVGGGFGGHNGLKSIGQQLGGPGFCRLRVGIGRPNKGAVSSWVLSEFGSDERPWLQELIGQAADAVELALSQGMRRAMNTVNQTKSAG